MKHLLRDLDNLKREMLGVGGMVEEALAKSARALTHRDAALAREVIEGDSRIDSKEVQIEEECLKILALHHPVATDLRLIITVLKVNNDLERMGDLAVNIAERATYLAQDSTGLVPIPNEMDTMVVEVRAMVRDSLDAVVEANKTLAQEVRQRDDIVDDLNRTMFVDLRELMHNQHEAVDSATDILSASRNLERIADLATNIAEDVIFMVEGEVVRHRKVRDSDLT